MNLNAAQNHKKYTFEPQKRKFKNFILKRLKRIMVNDWKNNGLILRMQYFDQIFNNRKCILTANKWTIS